ncbi:CRISPR-associated helicase/endonuclease Cas3 [Clostridium ihumii]|uniref:CRISPR-associated helicase/endonuclease Cas3 n=1 Tax=Clostridium ihumii TaxID=1470356 RepID=UPI0005538BDE|nr:CRISPR-associated helicase/endonuclease Cas3 [Clostridium ihumii]
MCTSFKLLSHSNLKNNENQLLVDHLNGVSNIMCNLALNSGIKDKEFLKILKTIGICHDFGKGSIYFQKYLKNEYNGCLKNHGEISAYLCYYLLPKKWKLYGFIAVKRHHGNIEIDNSFFHPLEKENLKKIITSLKENINELNDIYKCDLGEFFKRMDDGSLVNEVKKVAKKRERRFKDNNIEVIVEEFVNFQYIWSVLLTADKTQLIRGSEFKVKNQIGEDICRKYKEKIRKELKEKNIGIEKSALFNIRENIYKSCVNFIDEMDISKDKILSINVPTGTGKTIAVYGTALKLKNVIRYNTNIGLKIIYCLPFTSVIDQNYNVLEEMMEYYNMNISSELMMKYHSLCEIEYKDDESKQYIDFDGKFLFENWQSSIITTTFIQIFNVIFKSGINSIIHRFHNLAGSIIILDEVQAIDPKYYKIIEIVFKILTEKFNCYVITVTATKPLFLRGKELIQDNEKIFKMMNRIEFHNFTDKETSIEDFKVIIKNDINENKDKSFLFIMNTISSAKEIKNFLDSTGDKRKIYYLSTELLPIHRLEIINNIKLSKEKTILVSTQLVEAGVDIDYDVVYRDIAPLDSINQSAGRANRNGIESKGILNLYRLVDMNGRPYYKIYSNILLEITLELFKDKKVIDEKDIFKLNSEYFNKVYKVTENKSNEVSNEFINAMKNMNFKYIRDNFKLIDDDNFKLIDDDNFKVDVVINYDDEVQRNISIIKNSDNYLETVNAWRRLNQYKVSVSKKLVSNLYETDIGINLLDKCHYDKERGLVLKKTSFF